MHIHVQYLCSIFTLVFFSVDLLTRTGLSYFTREADGGIMLIVDSVKLHVRFACRRGTASYLRSTVTMETRSRDVKLLMHVAYLGYGGDLERMEGREGHTTSLARGKQ